jgi:alanine racemase
MPNLNSIYRPTRAEVNLSNLTFNFKQIKKLLKPETKIMVCVKSDAYGHGLVPVAKKLQGLNADFLGVATLEEAITLRKAGVSLPVLILGLVQKKDIKPLFKYNLRPTVCSEDFAYALNKEAARQNISFRIHIKVDTGMGRLGLLYKEALGFIKKIYKLKFINIEGVFTHLACADINRAFTLHQIKIFRELVSKLNNEGIHIPFLHTANSMGIIGYKESHFNMVRPGLVIYGLYPKESLDIKLKPVLSLKTEVIYLKRVPKKSGISYGHTYITKKDTNIAILPIGYGDGYPRSLSNKAPVLIRGKRFKISGRVCMDQVMVDVGDLPVKLGDEVLLIGSQGTAKITTEELARLCNTIPYEIVCGLGSRVPRIYLR